MTDQRLNINLDGLRSELQRSLQSIICLVSAGLNSSDSIDSDNLHLPTSIQHTFANTNAIQKDKFKNKFSEWILSNGLRDATESVSSFLESVHRVLTCWELAVKADSEFHIPRDDWINKFPQRIKQYHRFGLPEKLSHISDEHGIEIKESFKDQVLSINSARNCLVHRNGVVSGRDVNENNELVVKWLHMKLFVRNEDGDHDLVIGEVLQKESTICMRLEEKEKTFTLGSLVSFTVEEFSELTWCFFLFGEELIKTIKQNGVDLGFINRPENTDA